MFGGIVVGQAALSQVGQIRPLGLPAVVEIAATAVKLAFVVDALGEAPFASPRDPSSPQSSVALWRSNLPTPPTR